MKFYKCPLCCNITFSSIEELKKHLVRAASPLKCPICFTQCQNILLLVKHLDACKLITETISSEISQPFSADLARHSQISDNDDDDDVEGYFCTVCNTKIPNLEQHIQQYHTGQEIILQDDDDDDNIGDSHSTTIGSTLGSNTDTSSTKPMPVEMNGSDPLNDKNIRKRTIKDEEEINEAFYCTKCEKIVDSFAEHTASFHANDDVIYKDISVAELFTETKLKNGSQGYFCTSCQKPLARRKTLSKHIKLNACPQIAASKNKRKKSSESPNSNQSLTYGYNTNNQIHIQQSNLQSVYQNMKTGKSGSYSFEDLGHSIFNT